MKALFKKPYIYWLIGIFLLYMLVNIYASGFYQTIKLIFIYAKTVNWFELIISIIFSIAIGILVAINGVIAYIRHKERKKCREGATLASLGTLGGIATGVCPLCVTGIFPLILSALGISFSFASLPLGGIEIQVVVFIILLISLFMLKEN